MVSFKIIKKKMANAENVSLTIDSDPVKNWFKKVMKKGLTTLIVGSTVYQTIVCLSILVDRELITPTGIPIYGDFPVIQIQLVTEIETYSQLRQNDKTTVRVLPEKWMHIEILPDVKIKTIKIYPLGPIDRKMVDDIFDKLHVQKRTTLHKYPISVVWGMIRRKRKKRIIVDIPVTDFYFMPLQSDITFAITGCQYISVFDTTGFFHQWLIRVADREIFTVVSYRGQKQFNIAVIGFKNFSFYVQKKIDAILRVYWDFTSVYVNDIIVFNHIVEKHMSHLHSVFQLFDFYKINLSSQKSFQITQPLFFFKTKSRCFWFHYFN